MAAVSKESDDQLQVCGGRPVINSVNPSLHETAARKRLFAFANAVQPAVGAQQQLVVVDDGGRVGATVVVLEDVVGQQFKLRLGGQYESSIVLRDTVNLVVRDNGRRVDGAGAGLESRAINEFSVGRIQTVGPAAWYAIEVAIVVNR